jgi:hypothetical protein
MTNAPAVNPTEVLKQLTPDTLRARLDELEAERLAICTLLRAAEAKERHAARVARIRAEVASGK